MNHDHSTDIVVIGAGTAGLSAFHEIKASGAQVLLVDRGPLGTTCARVGCMPSKAALHAGEQWTPMLGLEGGERVIGARLGHAKPVARRSHHAGSTGARCCRPHGQGGRRSASHG